VWEIEFSDRIFPTSTDQQERVKIIPEEKKEVEE
jgi:hypothetical protein